MAQASDSRMNLVPTEHFHYSQHGDHISRMVIHDGEHVIEDENFDYEPSRPLDLIEVTSFDKIAEFSSDERQFTFWRAKSIAEGLCSNLKIVQ